MDLFQSRWLCVRTALVAKKESWQEYCQRKGDLTITRSELLERAKPILLNTEMVRAIQDGTKTVTRRVIKGIPETAHMFLGINPTTQKAEFLCGEIRNGVCVDWKVGIKLPFQIGDILYVRETWCKGSLNYGEEQYYYRADNKIPHCQWNPSVHMPKEAARIFLRVTDVRVERLQDSFFAGGATILSIINEGVKVDENCKECVENYDGYPCCFDEADNDECCMLDENRYKVSQLWNSTIKKSDRDMYGWAANPWVWVIEFERVEVIK